MNRLCAWNLLLLVGGSILSSLPASFADQSPSTPLPWKAVLQQEPSWYGSPEAVRIAENVLLYQRDTGGWAKNVEMSAMLNEAERADLLRQKTKTDSTFDNGATTTQLAYLARVIAATNREPFRRSFLKGLDYLLDAQYANGGWPQTFPRPIGYHRHITYNDGAMISVMHLLQEVARKEPDYAFVDERRRARAERAVQKGIECILKTQVVVNGKRTVWCAQHDEKTLAPAPARTYEKASLSGSESVGIVRFLMDLDSPDLRIIEAVEAAAAWFERAKLTGIKTVRAPDASAPKGYDVKVVEDPAAGPLWARFYEIGTDRPIFSGRDGVVKYRLAEIGIERRTGYAWYVNSPLRLLAEEVPAWRKKVARNRTSS